MAMRRHLAHVIGGLSDHTRGTVRKRPKQHVLPITDLKEVAHVVRRRLSQLESVDMQVEGMLIQSRKVDGDDFGGVDGVCVM